jgi:hypothetical protein
MRLLVLSMVSVVALGPFHRSERSVPLCSVVGNGDGPQPGTVEFTQRLVRDAEVIVRARALRAGEGEHAVVPSKAGWFSVRQSIEFDVLEVIKAPEGWVAPSPLYLAGKLTEVDDFNRGSVPYTFVRPAGAKGSCFATEYRRGGEFLLLLRPAGEGWYTPYWALLSPTNEQVRGEGDPWVRWVHAQVRSAAAPSKGA